VAPFGTFTVAEAVHIDTLGANDKRLILDLEPGAYDPKDPFELAALQHLANSEVWMHPDHPDVDTAGPARQLAELTATPTMTAPPDLVATTDPGSPTGTTDVSPSIEARHDEPSAPAGGDTSQAAPSDPSAPPAATTSDAP
jgi:hypothetical protein